MVAGTQVLNKMAIQILENHQYSIFTVPEYQTFLAKTVNSFGQIKLGLLSLFESKAEKLGNHNGRTKLDMVRSYF